MYTATNGTLLITWLRRTLAMTTFKIVERDSVWVNVGRYEASRPIRPAFQTLCITMNVDMKKMIMLQLTPVITSLLLGLSEYNIAEPSNATVPKLISVSIPTTFRMLRAINPIMVRSAIAPEVFASFMSVIVPS